ncbi:thioredoxin family protein [Ancylomarina sp. DW003]|nr:thioredoxin family protein [Ancylomarina sp. DW003]MDE5423048.1 thioredoxin family protein [Ancylomarina sp. DW003]
MTIKSLEDIEKLRVEREAFSIYFSSPNCSVCRVLKPKLIAMLKESYPKIESYYVDTALHPEIAAQLGFYTNPSFIVYLNGQEFLRRSRSISLQEIAESLERPYRIMF